MTTAKGTLAGALVAFQAEAPQIARSKTVKVRTKTGADYTFKYAPLEAILDATRPGLTKNGLAISQMLSSTPEGRPALLTSLLHVSGEEREREFPLPLNGHETAQEVGSMISYMRRYALVSLLGLATEDDDDGNHASGNSVAAEGDPSPGHSVKVNAPTNEEIVRSQFKQPAPPITGTITEKQWKMLCGMSDKLVQAGHATPQSIAARQDIALPADADTHALAKAFAGLTKTEASELIGKLTEKRKRIDKRTDQEIPF